MASSPKPKPRNRAKPTLEVSVAAVMLHARAIIEQGRTTEFLADCEKQGFSLRGTRAFLLYARDFAIAGGSKKPGGGPALATAKPVATEKFTTAVVTKDCDDVTKH